INRCFIFFLFQAEDGIRDRNVTGVQTCALPISSYSYWKLTLEKTNEDVVVEVDTDKTEKKKKKSDGKEDSNSTKKESTSNSNHGVAIATKNDTITNKVEERLNADEPIRFLIIGSDHMTSEDNTFPRSEEHTSEL